jgi:ABC-type branched-subunit amino acid transport system substrate-binding protein
MTCQTTSAVTESVVWQIAGKGSIGHLSIRAFGEPPTKRFKDFYERYEKKFNEPCSNIVIESYDVLLGLGDAIEKAKTLDPVTVANVWGKMKFETSYGPTTWVGTQDIFGFGVDRSIMYAFPMSRIGSNGKLETWMSKNWTE